MKNIYVGNLSYNAQENQLRELFEEFGEVASVRIIKDKFTGNSKGFAFVEMPSADQATQAINSLNGTEFSGRNLKINEARPRENNGGPREGGGNGGSRPPRRTGGPRRF